LVFCLGVLQHLPNPEAGMAALFDQVKSGGLLAIDHYALGLGWYLRTAPVVREVLRRLRPAQSAAVARQLVRFFLPFHRSLRDHRLATKLLTRLSPIISYYSSRPELSDDLQREWALLDTYDSLTDWFKHFRTGDSIRRTLMRLGATQVECWQDGAVIVARASRP